MADNENNHHDKQSVIVTKQTHGFQPGIPANPNGIQQPQTKQFRQTLDRCIAQDGKRLRRIAEKLLTCAEEGQPWAIQMVAERLDGRVSNTVDGAQMVVVIPAILQTRASELLSVSRETLPINATVHDVNTLAEVSYTIDEDANVIDSEQVK